MTIAVPLVCCVALFASALTLLSGFGLGTLLLPAFALFFPVPLAVSMTALVHLANNVFKLGLFGRHADRATVLRFGAPAVLAALAGAHVLHGLTTLSPVTQWAWHAGGRTHSVEPVNLAVAVLLVAFALFDMLPSLGALHFDRRHLILGGALSGFFGGLCGQQGALRAAFLVKAGLSKEAFLGTGITIACLVDISRLAVYGRHLATADLAAHGSLLLAATLSAFAGALAGARFARAVTLRQVQLLTGYMLIAVAVLLGAGVI